MPTRFRFDHHRTTEDLFQHGLIDGLRQGTRETRSAAYPIHPEIFDRLYTDWSTLLKFQRTRGVLRLMAAVIHSLWEKNDAPRRRG